MYMLVFLSFLPLAWFVWTYYQVDRQPRSVQSERRTEPLPRLTLLQLIELSPREVAYRKRQEALFPCLRVHREVNRG